MHLIEALQVLLELARQNVILDPEYVQEREEQEQAIKVVERYLKLIS